MGKALTKRHKESAGPVPYSQPGLRQPPNVLWMKSALYSAASMYIWFCSLIPFRGRSSAEKLSNNKFVCEHICKITTILGNIVILLSV